MKKTLTTLLLFLVIGCASFTDIRPEDSPARRAGEHLCRASNSFFFGMLCGVAGTIVLMKSNPGENKIIYIPIFSLGALSNLAAWIQIGQAGDALKKTE
jgi:hypothetical protein